MKIGAVFPQTEVGEDAGSVKAFAQAAEALGYHHLLAYDHVLGADIGNRPDFSGPYTSESAFHEVFVLFGYLAGLTTRIEFVTGVLILPQRQTVLVAKQAAEVDLLSNGRLRLGIGVGWNDVEYQSLNENFRNRGKRSEEQIAVLRALWSDHVIDFDGRWHTVDRAGIRPLPVQRPIPIWIGGYAAATMERVGRIGDGWFPRSQDGEGPTSAVREDLARIAAAARAAGRDPSEIGIEARIRLPQLSPAQWQPVTRAWQEAGATHLSVITMDGGLDLDAQLDLLRRYAETTGIG
jgi:probable F420-dependent oxidoreductase